MSEETVRETYREIANERSPERLDKAVLARATRAAKPRYSRLITWTRPMAWAATVLLSVALVLQITDTPEVQPAADVAPAFDAPAEDAPALRKQSELEDGPAPEENPALEESAQLEEIAEVSGRDDAQTAIQSFSSGGPPAGPQDPPAAPAADATFEPEAFEMKDTDILQRAEEMARTREGVTADSAFAASSAVGLRAVARPACDDTVTDDPETWLDCIENLEKAGFDDEAARQRELLTAAFPDFESD